MTPKTYQKADNQLDYLKINYHIKYKIIIRDKDLKNTNLVSFLNGPINPKLKI